MALQIFFGDDEHTAADGTYARLMKTRKWVYLSSALAVLLARDAYYPDAAHAIIKVISLPLTLLVPSVFLGLVYILLQYSTLLVQLYGVYDLTLMDRFRSRKWDDIDLAQKKLEEASKNLREMDRSQVTGMMTSTRSAIDENIKRESLLRSAVIEAEKEYSAAVSSDPSQRTSYRQTEIAIDFLRLAPPLLLGLWSLGLLLSEKIF